MYPDYYHLILPSQFTYTNAFTFIIKNIRHDGHNNNYIHVHK